MAVIALHAIARKRRELERRLAAGGDPRALRRALGQLRAAARLLSEPLPPKRKRSRKLVRWHIQQALWRTPSLSLRELTTIVCVARGDDPADRDYVIMRRVGDALYAMRREGIVWATGKRCAPIRWTLNERR